MPEEKNTKFCSHCGAMKRTKKPEIIVILRKIKGRR